VAEEAAVAAASPEVAEAAIRSDIFLQLCGKA
jgi:hypothetical protein